MLWQENGVSLIALRFIAKIRDNGERRQRRADQEFKPREHVGHGTYCVFYFRETTARESIACQCIVSASSAAFQDAPFSIWHLSRMMDGISGVQIGLVLRASDPVEVDCLGLVKSAQI